MLTPLHSAAEVTDYRGKLFIGTVVDNDDPSMVERVRVTIPGLYEGAVDNLPWVAPKVGKMFGNKPGSGVFSVPDVGSFVYVELQDGNPHYPMYVGSPVQSRIDLAEADINYPDRYGWKDKRGNLFFVDTTPGQNTIEVRHASGTFFRINNNGSIDLQAIGVINSQAPQWNHIGNVQLDGNFVLNGNQITTGNQNTTGNVFILGTFDQTGAPSTISGPLTVDDEVTALGTQLHEHHHSGVRNGPNLSGPPVNF